MRWQARDHIAGGRDARRERTTDKAAHRARGTRTRANRQARVRNEGVGACPCGRVPENVRGQL